MLFIYNICRYTSIPEKKIKFSSQRKEYIYKVCLLSNILKMLFLHTSPILLFYLIEQQ